MRPHPAGVWIDCESCIQTTQRRLANAALALWPDLIGHDRAVDFAGKARIHGVRCLVWNARPSANGSANSSPIRPIGREWSRSGPIPWDLPGAADRASARGDGSRRTRSCGRTRPRRAARTSGPALEPQLQGGRVGASRRGPRHGGIWAIAVPRSSPAAKSSPRLSSIACSTTPTSSTPTASATAPVNSTDSSNSKLLARVERGLTGADSGRTMDPDEVNAQLALCPPSAGPTWPLRISNC